MTLCLECNKEYAVEVNMGGYTERSDELDLDIPYCPFCGSDRDLVEGLIHDDELDS